MIDVNIIGLIGAVILVISWIYETIEGLKEQKELIDLRFAFANITAVGLLTIYSYMIENKIFFWLNVVLVVVVFCEITYTLKIKKVKLK